MKPIISLFLLLIISAISYPQSITIDTLNRDTSSTSIIQDSLTADILQDSVPNQVMLEKWDHKTFNPYRYNTPEYPFHISFTDSIYAAPMNNNLRVTSRFGWRNRRAHKGIDIDLVTGDTVMAMLSGKVRFVNYSRGHGKTIIVRHENGLETVYAHLSEYLVAVNDTVEKGQIIGKGGTTGNARGSHLHLVAIYKGVFINPEYLFDFGPEHKIRRQNVWVTKEWTTPYLHSSKRQSKLVFYDTYEEALASQKTQKQVYIIKQGDTLSGISYKYRIPVAKICRTNGIAKTSTLKIGQRLVLKR